MASLVAFGGELPFQRPGSALLKSTPILIQPDIVTLRVAADEKI
jgi:hypothetical protein